MTAIGLMHSGKLTNSQADFIQISNNKNIDVILIDISDGNINFEDVQRCNIIYNDSGEEFAIQYIKMFESMGLPVIDSSRSYNDENKWNFYQKCIKYNIPAPLTIKLSKDMENIKEELISFNHFPVILKRVRGTWGEYVARANNLEEAVSVIEKFWDKGTKKIPIIAQEFIDSFSYRVTYIDHEVVQTAIKENNNWKCTGVYAKNFKTFYIDENLKVIINKIMKHTDIKICGIDLLKKGNDWVVIEVNSEPALDFFEIERLTLISKIIDLLLEKSINIESYEEYNETVITKVLTCS